MGIGIFAWSVGFNPRPCARGDEWWGKFAMIEVVSIHAPARGATKQPCRKPGKGEVSIHAPARGATTLRQRITSDWSSFNPRPCARGDWKEGC